MNKYKSWSTSKNVNEKMLEGGRQEDRQADRQTDRQTGRQTDRQAGTQAGMADNTVTVVILSNSWCDPPLAGSSAQRCLESTDHLTSSLTMYVRRITNHTFSNARREKKAFEKVTRKGFSPESGGNTATVPVISCSSPRVLSLAPRRVKYSQPSRRRASFKLNHKPSEITRDLWVGRLATAP